MSNKIADSLINSVFPAEIYIHILRYVTYNRNMYKTEKINRDKTIVSMLCSVCKWFSTNAHLWIAHLYATRHCNSYEKLIKLPSVHINKSFLASIGRGLERLSVHSESVFIMPNLPNLTELTFSGHFGTISTVNFPSLRSLRLINTRQLINIPWTYITNLHLQETPYSQDFGVFTNLRKLSVVELYSPMIKTISTLTSLTNLQLDGYIDVALDGGIISNLTNLIKLKLPRYCDIGDKNILKLTSLQCLDVGSNISVFNNAISKLTTLRVILIHTDNRSITKKGVTNLNNYRTFALNYPDKFKYENTIITVSRMDYKQRQAMIGCTSITDPMLIKVLNMTKKQRAEKLTKCERYRKSLTHKHDTKTKLIRYDPK